jgi:hypothetical protein
MTSPAALGLLERAGIGPAELTPHLREKPFLVALLTDDSFAALMARVPAAVLLTLVASAPEERWPGWCTLLRDFLGDPASAGGFWLALDAALKTDPDEQLRRRILDNSEIARTVLRVTDPAILNGSEPALGGALLAWAQAHEALFTPNSALLLQAATHVLPQIRLWALERVQSLGMDLPFALRLLESQIPSSAGVGRAYCSAVAGTPEETTVALALCDSPVAAVREVGRVFALERWPGLPQARVLQSLFESNQPDIQAFVAERLAAMESTVDGAPAFDREVLRSRRRARRAKEGVKARQTATPTLDAETLLALARGRVGPDADWALAELAKRALAGEAVEGVTVEGVAGI